MKSLPRKLPNNIAPPVESSELQELQDEFDAALADVPVAKRVAMAEALMNLPETGQGALEGEEV